jgi:hypothetical protein
VREVAVELVPRDNLVALKFDKFTRLLPKKVAFGSHFGGPDKRGVPVLNFDVCLGKAPSIHFGGGWQERTAAGTGGVRASDVAAVVNH